MPDTRPIQMKTYAPPNPNLDLTLAFVETLEQLGHQELRVTLFSNGDVGFNESVFPSFHAFQEGLLEVANRALRSLDFSTPETRMHVKEAIKGVLEDMP